MDAVDTNVVWGIAADPANQLTPVQEFTKTVDGGNLWIAGPINNAAGLSPSGIFGLNADTAWTVMFNGASGGGSLLKTIDGGINWTAQPTAAFAAPAGFPNIVHFFDADNGITMGDPNGGYFEIYTTVDGGTNWIRTPQANIATQLTGEFGITSVYTSWGDSTLWFGTNLGRIYKTTDRGLNWTAAATPYTGFYIGDIAFRDANNGIASNGSPGALADAIRTTDGGATWTLIAANTAGILTKNLSFVPGTDSTYFLSSPQLGGGTAFSLTDANSWVLVDNLIHSDIDFVAATTGWTGSNELNAPMFKWVGPITVSCASLLGPLTFATPDSICTGESVDYSIHVDFTNDPQTRLGFNAVFYDEFFTQIGAQSVPDLVAGGFPNTFVPDPGQTTIGTLNFTIFFTVAAANEVVHFGIQVFPTQCTDDTSNFVVNSVFQDITICATAPVVGTSATVDLSACPQTGQVTYTYFYSVNGGPQIPGNQFNCTSNNGINNIIFYVDNGGCIKEISAQVNCVGVGIDEAGSNSFSMYPNPVNEMLNIELNSSVEFQSISITDISGREVIRFNNPGNVSGKIEIPTKALTSGTYFVSLLKNDASLMKVQRFVKL
ncbi:MAG: T9SS type A sorting domain-containing protein [Bacteroidetes bacterium]|nr:T9SS type A sorting domain-containing protein [Bacteroidota bacterium]